MQSTLRSATRREVSRKSKFHPAGLEHGVVLATVKVWPGDGGASLEVSATANLDGVCARRRWAAMPE
jgi:hypothetical protein